MPEVQVRKIFRLNEERLVAGLLPTPWMLGLAVLVGGIIVLNQPKGIADLGKLALIAAGLTAAFVSVHRVSRLKVISHWFKWHDVGMGGVIGRDLNPLPHRYQEMDKQEEAWFREQRRRDTQRANEYRRQVQALKKDEAQRNKKVIGRR